MLYHYGERIISVSIAHWLAVSIFLLFVGLYGLLNNRRQILVLLLSAEIIFLSGFFLFISLSGYAQNLKGHVFALLFLAAFVCKTVVGLALLLHLYKKRNISFLDLEEKNEIS
ncbi:MAG: NADH-quinone oxidoreductase subunit NuoK [Alphaproteobacteria bacterium]